MVRTKRRSQRQRSHRGGGGSLFGMNNSENYDGNDETIMGAAFRHGSNLTSAVGNKVGNWLKKQPVIREEELPVSDNRDDTDSSDERRDRKRAYAFDAAFYKKRDEERALRKANRWSGQRGGRSKKRGKRTRRKTKRRRH